MALVCACQIRRLTQRRFVDYTAQGRLLFEQSYASGSGITIANHGVTRDGQRFVMVKDESTAARLNVRLKPDTAYPNLGPDP